MKSPKTTGAAIIAIILAILGVVKAYVDGDPTTVPDFTTVGLAISAAIGFFFARDNDVTSEDAGALPKKAKA